MAVKKSPLKSANARKQKAKRAKPAAKPVEQVSPIWSVEAQNEKIRLSIMQDRFCAAVVGIGECLADIGRVMKQGARDDNEALRGNIALGLERAACYMRNQSFATKYPVRKGD